MNRTKKVFQDIYSNRRKILIVLLLVSIVPIFQNCGGTFSSSSTVASVGSAGGASVGGTGGTGGTGGGGTVGPTLDEVQKACKAMVSAPSLSAPSVASITVKSGLGDANSGDERTNVPIKITANRGVSNEASFTAGNCNGQFSLQLDCAVVEGDSSRPISMTNGFSAAGVDFLAQGKAQANLAKDSYSNQNCSVGFGVGQNTVDITIRPNTNTQRCSEGSYTLKLTARNAVTGQGAGFTSAPQYLTVKMNNGCWVESRLTDSAGIPAVSSFGAAVAINGSWAAVVAPYDDAGSTLDVGSVYMYKLEGASWNKKQKVQISTAAARDTITSVAINGDRMIIGSPSPYVGGQGNAYYFTQAGDNWTLARQISPPVSQSDQAFGQKVEISGGQIFVAAPNFNYGGMSKSGVVYVYNSDGSSVSQTLGGASAYVAFGTGLAVDGSVLAVGAPQAIGREGQGTGMVYVYTYSGSWAQAAVKNGTTTAETFGARVAVYGNRLAVSSPNYATGTNSGQGRVSYFASYADMTAEVYNGGATGDRLGSGLAMSSNGLYIGVPGTNGRAGRVDHYTFATPKTLNFRNLAYNGTGNSDFGVSVAATGTDFITGSSIKSDPNDSSGAAYIYRYK